MENSTSLPPRHWPFFLLGVAVFVLGMVLYAVLLQMAYLGTFPWYLPILATLGVLLMALSVWQRGGKVRSVALVVFVLLCGFIWYRIVGSSHEPEYTGPAKPEHRIPAFVTTLANGKSFSNTDLAQGRPTVLLFFRGRW
jgi:hypothetical protein